jgi:uracil-DNA glycosylase
MFQGRPGQRLMLIGQAPGVVEMDVRRPFAARAGKELERWMVRAGFRDDSQFRGLTYISSITKCFPGKARSGGGDRRPSATEVAQCRPWLDAQLELVAPRMILLVGTLAIDRFMPWVPLEELVGRLFTADGREADPDLAPAAAQRGAGTPLLLPLPHPSGASRWLNRPEHRELLGGALDLLRRAWPVVIEGSAPAASVTG